MMNSINICVGILLMSRKLHQGNYDGLII